MTLLQAKEGQIFAIGGTRSYPKLKLKVGYVDLRDEIYNRKPSDWDIEIITKEELYTDFKKRFRWDKPAVDDLIDRLKEVESESL